MKAQGSDGKHDRLVLQAARYLQQRFYRNIRSRVGSFHRPEPIQVNGNAYTPDVTVVDRNDVLHILEVETPEALENGNGEPTWQAVSEYAAKRGANFYLVVPEESKARAAARLQELNVRAEVVGLKSSQAQRPEE